MPLGQRVVLIGGGHNALIAAFYLAKGGFKPLVLERRETVGGGAVTEEFYPGFRASALAHTVGPLRADIRSEEHTSELQSRLHLVCRLLLEKKKNSVSTENLHSNSDCSLLAPCLC